MSKPETLYSARQLADELGITLQMLSIYAKSYQQVSKTQISKVGRLGRHFSEPQRQIIKNAREMVSLNTGVTVEEAMRKALVFDATAVEAPIRVDSATIGLEGLKTLLSESLRQEVAVPLIAEIKLLRAEVADLKQPNPLAKLNNPVSQEDMLQVSKPGVLVRFAVWFEGLLRK